MIRLRKFLSLHKFHENTVFSVQGSNPVGTTIFMLLKQKLNQTKYERTRFQSYYLERVAC